MTRFEFKRVTLSGELTVNEQSRRESITKTEAVIHSLGADLDQSHSCGGNKKQDRLRVTRLSPKE